MKFLERSELVTIAMTINALSTPGMMGLAVAPIISLAGGALFNFKSFFSE
jgi:hypothetical protein